MLALAGAVVGTVTACGAVIATSSVERHDTVPAEGTPAGRTRFIAPGKAGHDRHAVAVGLSAAAVRTVAHTGADRANRDRGAARTDRAARDTRSGRDVRTRRGTLFGRIVLPDLSGLESRLEARIGDAFESDMRSAHTTTRTTPQRDTSARGRKARHRGDARDDRRENPRHEAGRQREDRQTTRQADRPQADRRQEDQRQQTRRHETRRQDTPQQDDRRQDARRERRSALGKAARKESRAVAHREKRATRTKRKRQARHGRHRKVIARGKCLASYYVSGQVTANGQRFDPGRLTAAHKSLPFGSIVRVTSLDTGRSVIVRINDRGPYIAGRCIDLTRAAMGRIGGITAGVVPVRYEVLAPS